MLAEKIVQAPERQVTLQAKNLTIDFAKEKKIPVQPEDISPSFKWS